MPPSPHPSRRAPIAGLVLALLVLAAGVAHASSSPSRTSTGRPVYAGAARPDLEATVARAVTGAHDLEIANLTAWYAWAATLPPPPPPPPTTVASPTTSTSGTVGAAASDARYVSLEPCGGDLPPCWVKRRESGGDYSAHNPTGCAWTDDDGLTHRGCWGAWQFGTMWAGRLGLPADLSTATPAQQDSAARQLWNGGRGCRNWGACR